MRQYDIHPDCRAALRRTLGEQIIIETRLAAGIGRFHADPVELDNAILNLAVNARDAMPGGGTLTIETSNVEDDPWDKTGSGDGVPHVLIAVRDNGVGMDRQTAAKAFDPFFTTKEMGRGTGLGLSQVQDLSGSRAARC
jgi:signal transduction histidine kinase